MRRLEIPAGGMPFERQDLLWMQTGLTEKIEALAKPFLLDDCAILSGLEIDDNTLTAGTCIIDGKFYSFPNDNSVSGDLSQLALFANPNDEFDPAGSDIFADNVTRDTYRVLRAELLPATFNGGKSIKLSEIDKYRFRGSRSEKVKIYENGEDILEVVKAGHVAQITGFVKLSDPSNPITCTCPFRPLHPTLAPLLFASNDRAKIIIDTNGFVAITPIDEIPTNNVVSVSLTFVTS